MNGIEGVLNRLHAEFVEMPSLQLTMEQVQRLCGVDRTICQIVLKTLVEEEILCVSADGQYKRLRRREPSRAGQEAITVA